MSEQKTGNGRLMGIEIKKEGVNKNGNAYKIYSFNIQFGTEKRYFSAFSKFDDGGFNLGDNVKFTYTEEPNPKSEKYPYLTLKTCMYDEGNTPVLTSEQKINLLGEKPTVANLLEEEVKITMTPKEIETYNKLAALTEANKVSKHDFSYTMSISCDIPEERANAIWDKIWIKDHPQK